MKDALPLVGCLRRSTRMDRGRTPPTIAFSTKGDFAGKAGIQTALRRRAAKARTMNKPPTITVKDSTVVTVPSA